MGPRSRKRLRLHRNGQIVQRSRIEKDCCKTIDILVTDINNMLNTLINSRGVLYPPGSKELELFNKKIEEIRALLSSTVVKERLEKDYKYSDVEINREIMQIIKELKNPRPNYNGIYDYITIISKKLIGDDISDQFPTKNVRQEMNDFSTRSEINNILENLQNERDNVEKFNKIKKIYEQIFKVI